MSEFLSICPRCQQKIVCDTRCVGMQVVCPLCSQGFVIPEPSAENRPVAAVSVNPGTVLPGAGRRKWLWAVALAVVLLAALGAVGFWFKNNNGGNGTLATASTPPPALILLSQGRTVYASSFETGNLPDHANDGNPNTRWTAHDNSYPQWWVVDLGATYQLRQMSIDWYSGGGRYYGYKIDTSLDNISYNTAVNKLDNSVSGTTTDKFSATARYVRIMVIRCSLPEKYAAFYEVQVYGY